MDVRVSIEFLFNENQLVVIDIDVKLSVVTFPSSSSSFFFNFKKTLLLHKIKYI